MAHPSRHSLPSPPKPWRPKTDKLRSQHVATARQIVTRGRRDPAWFVETMLGSPLWTRQAEILGDCFQPNSRIAVKAGHSVGKTYCAARATLAWFYLFPGKAKIITTAPTWSQVSKLLWAEIGSVWAKLPKQMGGVLLGTELRGARDHFAIGLSTDSAERFQGHHSENLLVILDEAPGVRSEIWEAAESLRAGGNATLLVLGNPTSPSGPFYDCFTSNRAFWNCKTISAFDSPNLVGLTVEDLMGLPDEELDRNQYPTLTSRRWVKERALDWGIGSSLWQSRVLGEFPQDGDDSLIPLRLVTQATERKVEIEEEPTWQVGLDVAGPGADETVMVVRKSGRVVLMKAWASADPRGEVLAALAPYKEHNPTVCIDSIGIGYYMGQHIRDQGYIVLDVNVGRPAVDKRRFSNWKAELFWGLRDVFVEGDIELPSDAKLISQLSALRYEYNSRGLVQIESKDSMARRGVRSPDRAEALMLAFASSNRLQLKRGAISSEILL